MKPPIADPFLPPGREFRVFRPSFWRVYTGNVLFSLLFFAPIILLLAQWIESTFLFLQQGGGFLLFFLVFVNPLSAAFGGLLHPVKVNRLGIQGPPVVGFAEWDQMRSIRRFWMGISYARIPLQNHLFALWIPISLDDMKAFAQTVEEWAPADNPLRLFLEKRGF